MRDIIATGRSEQQKKRRGVQAMPLPEPFRSLFSSSTDPSIKKNKAKMDASLPYPFKNLFWKPINDDLLDVYDARLRRRGEIEALLRTGHDVDKVKAIKLYREDTGATLREANAAIDRLDRRLKTA
jgi:choline dehydrogenase-like flavoprotein